MYFAQGKNYGYSKKVEGGTATISYGNQSRREISKRDFEEALRNKHEESMSMQRMRMRTKEQEQLKDYKALLGAGIPDDTARRLTGYYG